MKTIIHVGRQTIDTNRKLGRSDPPLIARNYKGAKRANRVEILDKDGNVAGTVVYSPDKPLSCGARVWIETENEVRTNV